MSYRMSTSRWDAVPAAPHVPGHFWQARFLGTRAEWRLVDGRGSPTGWTVEQSSESAPCVVHGPGGFRAEAGMPIIARSIVAERAVKANPRSAKRNPVSVAFTPARRGGIDVAVNGRVVARAVASLHTAQSAALDGLSYFVDVPTARRLVQRAAEQLAGKFAGARAAYANPRAVSIRRRNPASAPEIGRTYLLGRERVRVTDIVGDAVEVDSLDNVNAGFVRMADWLKSARPVPAKRAKRSVP